MSTPLPNDSNQEATQSRRFFLAGLATFLVSFGLIVVGSVRSLIPNVSSGKPLKFKVGKPEDFADNSATYLEDQKLFIVRKGNAYLALSAVCTHLGCTVRSDADGEGFFCPCHGSRYKSDGKNYAGPAPKPLEAYELTLSPLNELVVDKRSLVSPQEPLRV